MRVFDCVVSLLEHCSDSSYCTYTHHRNYSAIEIKKMARENQMKAVKIMAKDLVRTRQYITKFIEMRSQLQGCALKLQTVKSHAAMAEAMSSTAKAMHKMNKAVDVASINKMMREFEKENMKSEMMQGVYLCTMSSPTRTFELTPSTHNALLHS